MRTRLVVCQPSHAAVGPASSSSSAKVSVSMMVKAAAWMPMSTLSSSQGAPATPARRCAQPVRCCWRRQPLVRPPPRPLLRPASPPAPAASPRLPRLQQQMPPAEPAPGEQTCGAGKQLGQRVLAVHKACPALAISPLLGGLRSSVSHTEDKAMHRRGRSSKFVAVGLEP